MTQYQIIETPNVYLRCAGYKKFPSILMYMVVVVAWLSSHVTLGRQEDGYLGHNAELTNRHEHTTTPHRMITEIVWSARPKFSFGGRELFHREVMISWV